jgi:hypothetical protein
MVAIPDHLRCCGLQKQAEMQGESELVSKAYAIMAHVAAPGCYAEEDGCNTPDGADMAPFRSNQGRELDCANTAAIFVALAFLRDGHKISDTKTRYHGCDLISEIFRS